MHDGPRPAEASLAQWQSNGFVNRRSPVRARELAPTFTPVSLCLCKRMNRVPASLMPLAANNGAHGVTRPTWCRQLVDALIRKEELVQNC